MESYLKKKFDIENKEAVRNAKISFSEDHGRDENRYRILQLLGPAIGFTLTISSLIVGLHPSLKEVQNIEIFFNTIQIAMVSTFLGLLIRILAIGLQSLNHKILIQTDEAFFKIEESLAKNNDA